MCISYYTSAWKFSEIFNLNFVDQISAINCNLMLMSPLWYNWNNALGIRVSVFITMKELLLLNWFFCPRLASPVHCNIPFSKFKGEYPTIFPSLSLLYTVRVRIRPHTERHGLIRRYGTADLFQLPMHFLPQQQPQSLRRATSITAELLLAACIKGRICRTKRSVSLQIHQTFSQMRRNFTWNSAWRSVLLCFLPVQELPGIPTVKWAKLPYVLS